MPSHETLNKLVVAGAVTSPWWIEPMRQMSEVASYAMPILGLVFLIAQMIVWFRKQRTP
jgi:hypothetical protein